jgi:hypothetical protein
MIDKTFDYAPPPKPDPIAPGTLHIIAAVLAIESTALGALCAILIAISSSWWVTAIFAPGYLMTAGYYWRAFRQPSLMWRRAIWIFSILVQGAWFFIEAWFSYDALRRGNLHEAAWGMFIGVWVGGIPLGLSAMALYLESAVKMP